MDALVDVKLDELNRLRRQAVEMRLAGATLAQIRETTGLSAPTVIGTYKSFLKHGWKGVVLDVRGRPPGTGRALAPEAETQLRSAILGAAPESMGAAYGLWTADAVRDLAQQRFGHAPGERALARLLHRAGLSVAPLRERLECNDAVRAWSKAELARITDAAHRDRSTLVWCGEVSLPVDGAVQRLLIAQTMRGKLAWLPVTQSFRASSYIDFLSRLITTWPQARQVLLYGVDPQHPALSDWQRRNPGIRVATCPARPVGRRDIAFPENAPMKADRLPLGMPATINLTHLQRLEAESIHIMREVVAECERPVMLYSIGKDSATMLHLARKAFYPATPPFPLLHVDTMWKFRDMYALRERMARESGMELLVWQNPEAKSMGINPFDHGSQIHTDLWKTQGLKQALDHYGFDAAFGGARRDEEKSRAKERIFSFRSDQHRWDPKNQRPELWNLYNARKRPGESIRVFPLSNWTELDIWQYIYLEDIAIVPLYLAQERPVVERAGTLLMVDDERFRLDPDEVPVMRKVRFRTLGCYPLSGAIESEADTLPAVIQEMLLARTSERQGRMIDHDQAASMEKKKQEGYF